jgi:hypothetical protein
LVLAETKSGEYTTSKQRLHYVNLIAIVCSKGAAIDQAVYVDCFLNLAKSLQWKLYLEDDDEGNEDILIA